MAVPLYDNLADRPISTSPEQLRHPIAKRVLEQVDQATRFISSDGVAATFFRRYFLPLIARRDFVQRSVFRNISGLAAPTPPWLK